MIVSALTVVLVFVTVGVRAASVGVIALPERGVERGVVGTGDGVSVFTGEICCCCGWSGCCCCCFSFDGAIEIGVCGGITAVGVGVVVGESDCPGSSKELVAVAVEVVVVVVDTGELVVVVA